MLSFTHTLVSLPFGIYLTNPVVIFLAAFVWHLFCDTLLHWNIFPPLFKKYPYGLVALDILAGLVVAWLLVDDRLASVPILAAIAGGNAPDVLHGLWDILSPQQQKRFFSWTISFFRFHQKLQLETSSFWWGIISQAALIIISLLVLLRLE